MRVPGNEGQVSYSGRLEDNPHLLTDASLHFREAYWALHVKAVNTLG